MSLGPTYCITGIQITDTATSTITKHRPTKSFSSSLAFLRIFDHTSIVKIVDAELKIEVSEDMSAANITAIIMPDSPGDISCEDISGETLLVKIILVNTLVVTILVTKILDKILVVRA